MTDPTEEELIEQSPIGDESNAEDQLLATDLIEEVSIDGMCGVY